MGYQNAGPQTLGAWCLTGFLSALPAAGAGPAERLGAIVVHRSGSRAHTTAVAVEPSP